MRSHARKFKLNVNVNSGPLQTLNSGARTQLDDEFRLFMRFIEVNFVARGSNESNESCALRTRRCDLALSANSGPRVRLTWPPRLLSHQLASARMQLRPLLREEILASSLHTSRLLAVMLFRQRAS